MEKNEKMSKKILIINTGGTLSSVKGANGLVPGISGKDMMEELKMVSKILHLRRRISVLSTVPISDRKIGRDWHRALHREVMSMTGLW